MVLFLDTVHDGIAHRLTFGEDMSISPQHPRSIAKSPARIRSKRSRFSSGSVGKAFPAGSSLCPGIPDLIRIQSQT
jgi:hypothetical protein